MKKRLLSTFLLILLIFSTCANGEGPKEEYKEYRVMPIYFYPADITPNPLYPKAIDESVNAIQEWYGVQMNGPTFEYDHVIAVRGDHDLSWYQNPQKILEDLSSSGIKPNPQILLIFVDGSELRGLSDVSDLWAILGERTLMGIAADIHEFGFSKNSQRGAIAHELGHAFGLSHPESREENKDTVMLSWAYFPELTLLDPEIEFLQKSPFFK